MSSNLLKMGYTNLQDGEKRVIDTNVLMARRMEALAAKAARTERVGSAEAGEGFGGSGNGFSAGLSAEQVEGGPAEEETASETAPRSNVIKANPDAGANSGGASGAAAANAECDRILADARRVAEELLAQAKTQASAEADRLLADARTRIAAEREETLSAAREQGYQDGINRAQSEFAAKEKALSEQQKAMEAEYEEMVDSLEPRFVDAITGVYEHLFGVELSSYREILVYLIGAAVCKIEGRDFLVHVSAEDYPYVSMEKKKLMSALTAPTATLELVEDSTLKHNECMIETEGGIFDCGLGTQLAELRQKLKLLSYEKPVT